MQNKRMKKHGNQSLKKVDKKILPDFINNNFEKYDWLD